ncbi:YrbL family protein [Poseidonocella sedimentorum]|uniref:PhoP regulatory network protein YrbL n=1 Tax=Poseidonocella sedimentorum TaxID=871652 RepID=A0A1I6CQL1_9RHOB|nr:YrbL family protein [Poseidonocella sedimentorum]SFQ95486.1 PhoP regulatory network protein YrbL [Poseidonocella sedimentorum]
MIIDLSHAPVLRRGGKRSVFEHPTARNQLIKVLMPRTRKKEARRGLWERLTKPPYEWEYLRELRMVYEVTRRAGGIPRLPIVESAGLVRTTEGLGLSIERITAPDGQLAPTMRDLLESGAFTAEHLRSLNHFVAEIYRLGVVANDLAPHNIVYEAATGHAIMIDGFGERTLIPLHLWSQRANARHLDSRFERYAAQYQGLRWDRARRSFHLET